MLTFLVLNIMYIQYSSKSLSHPAILNYDTIRYTFIKNKPAKCESDSHTKASLPIM